MGRHGEMEIETQRDPELQSGGDRGWEGRGGTGLRGSNWEEHLFRPKSGSTAAGEGEGGSY